MRRITALAFGCLMLAGCGGDPSSPEEQIQMTFDQIESAAEKREIGNLMDFVSESYLDEQSRTKKDVRAVVQLEFIRNPKIHVFKLLRDLTVSSDTTASANLLVAVAGRPIDNASALAGLRADLLRFELQLVDEGGWKIRSADWQWADASDFL